VLDSAKKGVREKMEVLVDVLLVLTIFAVLVAQAFFPPR
jgi:hypothetical protein